MTDPEGLPSAREMVDAFVRPARVIATPHRAEDALVLVVSHVEVWPWRVVVRGLRADPAFEPLRREVSTIRHGISMISAAPVEGAPLHRDFDWFHEWRLTDDCGTAYRMTGGDGDFRGVLWTDFHVAFEPKPPESASALTVHVPAENPITVPLD